MQVMQRTQIGQQTLSNFPGDRWYDEGGGSFFAACAHAPIGGPAPRDHESHQPAYQSHDTGYQGHDSGYSGYGTGDQGYGFAVQHP